MWIFHYARKGITLLFMNNNKDYANSWNVDVLSDTYEKTALACIEYVLDNLI